MGSKIWVEMAWNLLKTRMENSLQALWHEKHEEKTETVNFNDLSGSPGNRKQNDLAEKLLRGYTQSAVDNGK
jgi:hypothetical protein